MAIYLVPKDNKPALSMVKKIQESTGPYVLCSEEELREFNKSVTVLPDREPTQCPSLIYLDAMRQAQREYNFKVSKIIEDAAYGICNYDTTR